MSCALRIRRTWDILGRHLAANLARGGFHVGVYDLNRAKFCRRRIGWPCAQAGSIRWRRWRAPAIALITCLPSPDRDQRASSIQALPGDAPEAAPGWR
jgi:3-hydroxyisobutyrate dehydrogenase-like beta-hydroxyacid dehydrogenase